MRSTTSHPVRNLFSPSSRLSIAALVLVIITLAFSVSASLIKTRLHKQETANNAQPPRRSRNSVAGKI